MITEIIESKTLTKHIYANVNVNLIVKNVSRIKTGITINVGECKNSKEHNGTKKIIFRILLDTVVKMVKM